MAVMIGSAHGDEKGGINGKPGDQKGGGEVSAQKWYLHKKGWTIIRVKDPKKRGRVADAMQAACDNDHFGYGQSTRRTGYNAAKEVGFDPAKVKKDVNIDCSELVRLCLAYAGINVPDWSTASMIDICRDRPKDFEIITGDKAKTSKYLLRGDILVTNRKGHTVVVLSNGSAATDPDVGEKYAGKFPSLANGRGWYQEGDGMVTLTNYPTQIKRLQRLVNWINDGSIAIDGEYGPKTKAAVEAAQKTMGVKVTGRFDRPTLNAAKAYCK